MENALLDEVDVKHVEDSGVEYLFQTVPRRISVQDGFNDSAPMRYVFVSETVSLQSGQVIHDAIGTSSRHTSDGSSPNLFGGERQVLIEWGEVRELANVYTVYLDPNGHTKFGFDYVDGVDGAFATWIPPIGKKRLQLRDVVPDFVDGFNGG